MQKVVKRLNPSFKLLLLFIWPFGALLLSLKNRFVDKVDRTILFFVSPFVGLCLALNNETNDVHSYIYYFTKYGEHDNSYLIYYIEQFIALTPGYNDIGNHLIYFFVSRITLEPRVLLMTMGLTYGIFYSKVVIETGIFTRKKGFIGAVFILILLVLLFPTQAINQRFWIAGMIYFVGLQQYIIKQKFSGIAFILLSPLMHIGLSLFVIGFIIYQIALRFNINIYILLACIPVSFIISSNFVDIFAPLVKLLGGSLEYKFSGYSGDLGNRLIEAQKSRSWYAVIWRQGALNSLLLLQILMVFKSKATHTWFKNLLLINVILFNLVILLSQFSMGFRYFELMIFLQAMTIYIYIQLYKIDNLFKGVFLATSPLIFLMIFMKISAILQLLEPSFFFMNYFTEWAIETPNDVWSYIDIF